MPTNLRIYDGSTDPDDHVSCFVGAANQGKWHMPVWCRMFQQTLDGPARGRFDRLPNGCIDNWADLREKFIERFTLRRRCFKDPTEISAFMSNSKCPELARRFSDQVPKTVTEMMKRVDDFINSKEVYRSTKLPRGEFPEKGQGAQSPGNRPSLDALTKWPKEILATELQLQLPPCPPMVGTPKKENLDRYCDYHGEKGHYTNDCYQLKRQLKRALESGKLSHLVKDVRKRQNAKER
ncbi:hypothetical protein Tco_1326409 [Tanacetum coccineum]